MTCLLAHNRIYQKIDKITKVMMNFLKQDWHIKFELSEFNSENPHDLTFGHGGHLMRHRCLPYMSRTSCLVNLEVDVD
jgi:hypothetical protein